MASITNRADGSSFLQFVLDGKRHTIHLGKLKPDQAKRAKKCVEGLVRAKKFGPGDEADKLALWLHKLDDKTHEALARTGLVSSRKTVEAPLLGAFIDDFIAKHTGVKPNTTLNLIQARRYLVEHFGAHKPINDITPGDADGFLRFMREQQYAKSTTKQMVQHARQFFKAAVRGNLLPDGNPFDEVRAPAPANTKRQHFVSRDVAAQVLDACPDHQWRLLFALSRYGGLRCPSEHLVLTWVDVNWEKNRFRVDSPKTGERWVPIFPELRPYLEEAFDLAPEGSVHVITGYRKPRSSMRKVMTAIIRHAGLTPWPKLFHNLRASRETELAAEYPLHVVCRWIGNSATVAAKHYLQVTEGDFERASCAAGALQKAQQYGPESTGTEKQTSPEIIEKPQVLPSDSELCGSVPDDSILSSIVARRENRREHRFNSSVARGQRCQ